MAMETLFQALDELDDFVEMAWRRLLLYFNSSSTSSPPSMTTRIPGAD